MGQDGEHQNMKLSEHDQQQVRASWKELNEKSRAEREALEKRVESQEKRLSELEDLVLDSILILER